MGRRPAHPRFKRTRDTHDPQTNIPDALLEELSLPANADGSSVTKVAGRKAERKRKRREKRQADHQATLEWRARRLKKNPSVQSSLLAEETAATGDATAESSVHPTPKRKRTKTKQQSQPATKSVLEADPDPSAGESKKIDDPDAREARRLEKLLGISRKKRRKASKGNSFTYSDTFGDDDELVDLLNFCDDTVKDHHKRSGLSEDDRSAEDDESDLEVGEESGEDAASPGPLLPPAEENEKTHAKGFHGTSDDEDSSGSLGSVGRPDAATSRVEKDTDIPSGVEEKTTGGRNSTRTTKKYVPPGSRGQTHGKAAVIRKLRGLLNRVADANASGVANNIVQIFERNDANLSQQDIADMYAKETLNSVRDGSGLGYVNPYIQSHAAIACHVAHRVSSLILASLVVSAMRRFDCELRTLEADSEILNENGNRSDVYGYVALVGSLYERGAVSCNMVYDVVRSIAEPLSSERLGLLLALLRQVGSMLRRDDPAALKDLIEFIHSQAEKLTAGIDQGAEEELGLKLQIMLDLIDDIKNNKLKRSALQEANARFAWVGVPETPLSASLRELLDDNFTSTQWWQGEVGHHEQEQKTVLDHGVGNAPATGKTSEDQDLNLNGLASSLRLNAGRRKDLFKVIVGSANVSDAYERLESISAFDSKKHHDRDTAIVILHCCGSEKMFNPFYAYLAERMCNRARRSRFTFEFACWDIFKSIAGSAKTKPMSKRKASNFRQLLAHLWCRRALSLSVLRCVPDFEDCDEHEVAFYSEALELLFTRLEKEGGGNSMETFEKLSSETWKGADAFRVSLALFLRRSLRPRIEKAQRKILGEAVRVLEDGKET